MSGVLAVTLVGAAVASAATAGTAGAVTSAASVATTSNANPSACGQPVTLGATVTDPGTPKSQLTGKMTFGASTVALTTTRPVSYNGQAGTYATSSYARNIDTGDETGAVASLIVE